MKIDITNDIILTQNFLSEIGFLKTHVSGFVWYYQKLYITLSIIDLIVYSDDDKSKYQLPHIKLSLKYEDITTSEDIDVNVTQDWLSIRQILLGSSITDLGIKPLNRSIKLYCILNDIEYKESVKGSCNCLALKLKPRNYLKF